MAQATTMPQAGSHETNTSDAKEKTGQAHVDEDHSNEPEQEEMQPVQKQQASEKQSRGKKRDASKQFRKAPGAPKRFKSSYIFFFMDCQARLAKELGQKFAAADISRRSAAIWHNLPSNERAHWDDLSAQDKERYLAQKDAYTGPWQIPVKRTKKQPGAPKRPMSQVCHPREGYLYSYAREREGFVIYLTSWERSALVFTHCSLFSPVNVSTVPSRGVHQIEPSSSFRKIVAEQSN
jgi:hypothetical protein